MTTTKHPHEAREGGTISTVSFWKVASAYRHAQGDELLKAERALIDFIDGRPQAGAAVPKITREAFERWWATFGDPKLLLEPAWDALTKIIAPAPTDTGVAGAGEVKPWQERIASWARNEGNDALNAREAGMQAEIADLRAQLALALQQRNQTLDELARAHAQLAQHQDSKPTDMSKRLREYAPGNWFDVRTLDEMQAFYLSRLPAIREAAKEHGYAIGLHGSARRDFDLMAMQWRENASDKDTLAHAIAVAACGITCHGNYVWEKKPSGRFAVSLPICWTDHSNPDFDKPSMGHIDLSVIDLAAAQGEPVATPKYQVWQVEPASCWCDVSKAEFDAAGGTKRIVYTTPPAAQAVPGDEVRDAKRWRFSMEFQESARTGAPQPEPIKAMWRKVYAEGRLHPTREEYEAATDAAIALRATKTEGEEQQ